MVIITFFVGLVLGLGLGMWLLKKGISTTMLSSSATAKVFKKVRDNALKEDDKETLMFMNKEPIQLGLINNAKEILPLSKAVNLAK